MGLFGSNTNTNTSLNTTGSTGLFGTSGNMMGMYYLTKEMLNLILECLETL